MLRQIKLKTTYGVFRFIIIPLFTCSCFFQGFSFERRFESNLDKKLKLIKTDSSAFVDNPKFVKKYNSLVARAYFKIIVDAERADIRLGQEYKNMFSSFEANTLNSDSRKKFVKTYEKFLAHRRMLKGLKSWRIFSTYRTGDLEYFKAENYHEILSLYQSGVNERSLIEVLMYKLADLYHFGE